MKFKCVNCKCDNIYLKCHMCRKFFSVAKEDNNPVMCKECEEECEQIYIETLKNKKKLQEQRELEIQKLPEKYKSLLISFDGFE